MCAFWLSVGWFLRNPYLNLGLGLALVVTAVSEASETLLENVLQLGAHHGVLLIGLVTGVRAVQSLFSGVGHLEHARGRTAARPTPTERTWRGEPERGNQVEVHDRRQRLAAARGRDVVRPVLRPVGRILGNPCFNLVLGLLLIGLALFEMLDTALEAWLGVELGAQHGVLVIGLITAIKAVHELVLGFEHIERVEESP